MDYSGKIIKKTPVVPSQTSASGVWTLDDALQATKSNTWPVANVPDPISRSLRFRSSASAYLSRTPATAGNRQTFTYSIWAKRGKLGAWQDILSAGITTGGNPRVDWTFNDADRIEIDMNSSGSSWDCLLTTTAVYRDPSAWYHVVVAVDTTQATSSNRVKIYVNGSQVTSFVSSTYPAQNASMPINNTIPHSIGNYIVSSTQYYDGLFTEVYLIDGQALTPSSFGGTNAVTGVWEPRPYTGTYGTNGFLLTFSDNTSTTTLGNDTSGNSNNWTTNNISLTAGSTYDSMLDVPTQWIGYNTGDVASVTRGNYATLNPLNSPSGVTLSSGNLNYTSGGASNNTIAYSGISVSSGKWYAEYTHTTGTQLVGIAASTASATLSYPGQDATSYGYASNNGQKYNNGATAYGATWTANDVIGIALDLDAGTLTFYKNGTSQGTAFTGITGTYKFGIGNNSGSTVTGVMNFGQRPFSYTPPAGFLSLCTTNLPNPTILQGDDYFDISLWTGNASTQVITNSGSMQPDFVWIKERSSTSSHALSDSVRGAGNLLSSNTTDAEATGQVALTSFNSNGFTVGDDGKTNESGQTYVGWQWKASGSTVSNTAGSITSTVSANTTAGFSVLTYTGTNNQETIGHGLGVAPSMIIVKTKTGGTENWAVYHASIGAANKLFLNLTSASTATGNWQSTSPTSTVFYVDGSSTSVNASGYTYVAYCFAAVAGYSAFGSFTGNASSDGPFVYLGFRPKFLMTKNASNAVQGWTMQNPANLGYNVVDNYVFAQSNAAQDSIYAQVDFLSNGFKFRTSDALVNGSGNTIIYMAFAENPFKNALAR